MKKGHSIFWYIFVFPFAFPFYATWILFKYTFIYSIALMIWFFKFPVRLFNTLFRKDINLKAENGYDFEKVCAEYLVAHGFSGVSVTQKSGDQGVDVIAYKKCKKYAVQCKYYSSPVGNSAVQEVYAGKAFYNCDCAIVMTNTTFTKSAKELAESTGVILMENIKGSMPKLNIVDYILLTIILLSLGYGMSTDYAYVATPFFVVISIIIIFALCKHAKTKKEKLHFYENEIAPGAQVEVPAPVQHEKVIKENMKNVKSTKNNMSYQQLEEFMIACNSKIEHDEEMEMYKK